MVLLPGMDGTGKLFAPFLKQFSDPEHVTVVIYPLDKHIPFEQLADYIIPLLPTDKPLVILGESYSGPVALTLAAGDELDICGIILVASFAKYPASFLKSISKWLPLSLLLRLPIPDFAIRYYCFGSKTNKTLSTLLRDSIHANTPNVMALRIHDGASVDVTTVLDAINVPCLYIAASDDNLVPSSVISHLKIHLPDLEVVTIQGSHFILQAQPAACVDVINDFLFRTIHID